MGAWAAGSFENDTAMDWVSDLRESGKASTVRNSLSQVIEQSAPKQRSFVGKLFGRREVDSFLEVPVACEALAAAEIVACWLGHPLSHIPDGVTEWVREHSRDFSPEIVRLARQAVAIIKTKSELKDLWEEGDTATAAEWHTVIADLENRLQREAV